MVTRVPDSSTRKLSILSNCKGVLRPGTTTLLIAPPGHGKTTFLRALSGRLPQKAIEGKVCYSGVDIKELKKQGIFLQLLSNYVDQLDTHLPFLTVRETATFACNNATVEPHLAGNPELEAAAGERVQRVLELLKLTNCANTLVGNELVRGISGGEKKRVTIAEALVSNARLLCMDEISTGLDASVTYDICASIRAWAQEMRGTVVVALLQPTPEVYSQFDDVLLMREGAVVFHGPRTELPGYLTGLGFTPPIADDDSSDMADWLVDLLASPTSLLRKTVNSKASQAKLSSADLTALAAEEFGSVPRTTAALVAAWTGSAICAARSDAPLASKPLVLASDFAKQQYGRPYPRSTMSHFRELLDRQVKITSRNKPFVIARVMSASIMSCIFGSMWFKLNMSEGLQKYGMLLFSLLQIGFSNLAELPFAVEYKLVACKQIKAGLYPASGYTWASTMTMLPISVVETAVFSAILYFMVGLVDDGGRWAFFYMVLLIVNVGFGSLYRGIAYVVPSYEAAQTAPGPFIAMQVIFAGFLVPPKHMGTVVNGTPWLLFMYYCSLFAYALRSLAQNEFYAPKYAIFGADVTTYTPVNFFTTQLSANVTVAGAAVSYAAVPTIPITDFASGSSLPYFSPGTCGTFPGLCDTSSTLGVQLLQSLNINLEHGWKWGGVGFILFFLFAANIVSSMALAGADPQRNIGTSRTKDEEEPVEGESAPASAAVAAAGGPSVPVEVVALGATHSVLPFTPMTVAWRDLKYTVQLNKNLGGGEKTLLQGVSGVAMPGKLLALMGASGAGKSTLLDVIAGRKTGGTMEGGIFLNGHPKETKSFARLTAYCEQVDTHNTFATVSEALHFSAALRLPSGVSRATKDAFVEEVIDLLELRSIADRLIGETGAANGLAPGQRKILTVAVEMVSNAPILFLDEPTSGLDSRAAAVVIGVVRTIATTGRTVITTIHQPNSEIFFKFDEILLMQRGGWMAYYGPIGSKGRLLISYVESLPGVGACPAGMNPASWMLDVLSGSDSSGGAAKGEEEGGGKPMEGAEVQAKLLASPSWAASSEALALACIPKQDEEKFKFASVYARSFPQQLSICLYRALTSHNRNVSYQFVKIMTILGLNTMFGTIYYKIKKVTECAPATGADHYACNNDLGGVQSVVAVVFITALFTSFLCMSTVLPVMVRERAVLYRERFSYMYAPEIHALSYFLAEVPWLVFQMLLTFAGTYFMLGFEVRADFFWTYIFIVGEMVLVFISIGQWAAAHFPTADVAQTTLGVILPLCFLFGGLYLPKPLIPNGPSDNPVTNHPHIYWQWAVRCLSPHSRPTAF